MKRIKPFILPFIVLLTFLAVTIQVFPAQQNLKGFHKAMVYLLMEDTELSQKYFNTYYQGTVHPAVKSGFNLLLENKHTEATRQFKSFLDINHRSTIALVGIALSTAHMKITNSLQLLERAIQLEPRFAPAYLCLGMAYLKQKNYPQAENYFKRAHTLSQVPEYKIPLAKLYLMQKRPALALNLLKSEAEAAPENFYFNLFTARSYFQLKNYEAMGRYIQAAIETNPKSQDARLLMAKFQLNRNNPQKARRLLKELTYEEYNEDYTKTFGHVLLKLNEKKARNYLYQAFSRNKWDKDINKFLGLYHWRMGDKKTVQHWINRAILCGNSVEELAKLFPDTFQFPLTKTFPFFMAKKIQWLSEKEGLVLVAGPQRSGEIEKIFVIDINRMRVLQALPYRGGILDLCMSSDHQRVLFSTTAQANKTVFLYALMGRNNRFTLRQLTGRPLEMPDTIAGFNHNGSVVYVTDKRIQSLAFESPFAQISRMGDKKPIYPRYPFPIYSFNFNTSRFAEFKDRSQLDTLPIEAVRKYALVSEAVLSRPKIQELVAKGKELDLTSDESVKIYFSHDLKSFIIYVSDSTNAFHGVVCNNYHSEVAPIDETMFLGKTKYADLTLLDFDPLKRDIFILLKNKEKDLIRYNYRSHITTYLGSDVYKFYYKRQHKMIYLLSLKSDKTYFMQTGLQIISLKPYVNEKVQLGKAISAVLDSEETGDAYFSTFDGENVKMDPDYKITYLRPSLEDCLHRLSTSGKKTVAFINGNLLLLE